MEQNTPENESVVGISDTLPYCCEVQSGTEIPVLIEIRKQSL